MFQHVVANMDILVILSNIVTLSHHHHVRRKHQNLPTWNYNFISVVKPENPCEPSPCGPNSKCQNLNNKAICSCLDNYIGHPPSCRSECVVSSECSLNKACIQLKCNDPCPGTCGHNARCEVINHNPICSCSAGETGDPFIRCYPTPSKEIDIKF